MWQPAKSREREKDKSPLSLTPFSLSHALSLSHASLSHASLSLASLSLSHPSLSPTLCPFPLSPLSNPAFSNALVAALKRAQAHQQRVGASVDPPLTPIKVEVEQLVISIVDDPGVSRVMHEAGFSSTCVKSSVELDCTSSSPSSSSSSFKGP